MLFLGSTVRCSNMEALGPSDTSMQSLSLLLHPCTITTRNQPMFTIMNYSRYCVILYLTVLCSLANGQQHEYRWNDRPFAVWKNQNLAMLVSVLCVLLFVMIIMAVFVYKPLRHR